MYDYGNETYKSAGSLEVDKVCTKMESNKCKPSIGDVSANWKRSESKNEIHINFNLNLQMSHCSKDHSMPRRKRRIVPLWTEAHSG